MAGHHDPSALARNRRATYDYEILETHVAGLALSGTEVKSVRSGHVQIADGFVRIENGEAFLYNVHISPYEQGNRWNVDPTRKRKLLLTGKEIRQLAAKMQHERLAIVPLRLFVDRGWLKLEIGLGRGKRKWDKRVTIERRDSERDADREIARAKKRLPLD